MEKKSKKTSYTVVLEILGEQWKGEGITIEDAILQIPLTWNTIKGKGILTVSSGTKKHIRLMNKARLTRMFCNKIARASMSKDLLWLLEKGVKTNIPEVLNIKAK